MNILFVCSRNQWRSPTAEAIYKNTPAVNVKSAGTEPSARIKLTAKNIAWADIIFVMEKRKTKNFTNKNKLDTDILMIEEIKTKVDSYLPNKD